MCQPFENGWISHETNVLWLIWPRTGLACGYEKGYGPGFARFVSAPPRAPSHGGRGDRDAFMGVGDALGHDYYKSYGYLFFQALCYPEQ